MERCWDWTRHYGGQIIEQLKALGCSYDWERLRFTLDDDYYRAVLHRLRAVLRTRLDLPRPSRGQLVSYLQLHCLRSRGGAHHPLRPLLADPLSPRRRRRLRDRRHHAARDDARRYRGGGELPRPALPAPPRQAGPPAAAGSPHPDHHRRPPRRPRVRHRRGEGDPRARPERLRGRPAQQVAHGGGDRAGGDDDEGGRARTPGLDRYDARERSVLEDLTRPGTAGLRGGPRVPGGAARPLPHGARAAALRAVVPAHAANWRARRST